MALGRRSGLVDLDSRDCSVDRLDRGDELNYNYLSAEKNM